MTVYRCAVPEDLPAISRHLLAFYLEGRFREKGFRYDTVSAEAFVEYALKSPDEFLIMVAMDGEKCVGSICGSIRPWMGDFRQKIVAEIWWWVDRPYRGSGVGKAMLNAYEEEITERGIDFTMLGTHDFENERALARVYENRGYKHAEHFYMKETPRCHL